MSETMLEIGTVSTVNTQICTQIQQGLNLTKLLVTLMLITLMLFKEKLNMPVALVSSVTILLR